MTQTLLRAYLRQGVLHHGRERVLLQDEEVGGLTFHGEAVRLAVVAHRTHKVLELSEQVGQLQHSPVHPVTRRLHSLPVTNQTNGRQTRAGSAEPRLTELTIRKPDVSSYCPHLLVHL